MESRLGVITGGSARAMLPSSATQSLSSEAAAVVGGGYTNLPSPPLGGGEGIGPVGPTPPVNFPIPIRRQPPQPLPPGGGLIRWPIGPIRLPISPPLPPWLQPRQPPQPLPPGGGPIHCLGPECQPVGPIGPIRLPIPPLPPGGRNRIGPIGPPPLPIHRGPYSESEINYWRQIIENVARQQMPALSPARPTIEHVTVGGPATVGNVVTIAGPIGRAQVTSLGAPSAVVRTATQGQVATAGGVVTAENVQNPLLTRYLSEVYAPLVVQTVAGPPTVTCSIMGCAGLRASIRCLATFSIICRQ